MLYPEFSKYKSFVDPQNPLVNAYQTKAGDTFYVEPGFYMGLQGFEEKRAKDMPLIMKALEAMVAFIIKSSSLRTTKTPSSKRRGTCIKRLAI
jgi:polyhydroxyalkanoate synthesis regulator protein